MRRHETCSPHSMYNAEEDAQMTDESNAQDETRARESVEQAFSAPEGDSGIGGQPDESIRTGILDTRAHGSVGHADTHFEEVEDVATPRDVSEAETLAGDNETAGDLGTGGQGI